VWGWPSRVIPTFSQQWFSRSFYIVEQVEPATKLYLILSGQIVSTKGEATLGTFYSREPPTPTVQVVVIPTFHSLSPAGGSNGIL
jgi:hypothetical protein